MCGRYFFAEDLKKNIEEDFGIPKDAIHIDRSGDVTPGMSPLVLTHENDRIVPNNMFWGYKGRDDKLIINARAETATERKMFAEDIKHYRCILPASKFFEWDKDHNRITFFRKDESAIYLAGFYSPQEKRFVIITRPANTSMIKFHDRMPLMMEKEEVLSWLKDDLKLESFLAKELPKLKNDSEYEQLTLGDYLLDK